VAGTVLGSKIRPSCLMIEQSCAKLEQAARTGHFICRAAAEVVTVPLLGISGLGTEYGFASVSFLST